MLTDTKGVQHVPLWFEIEFEAGGETDIRRFEFNPRTGQDPARSAAHHLIPFDTVFGYCSRTGQNPVLVQTKAIGKVADWLSSVSY